eukprot:CAMPEP_0184656108 /NCGR_PEP_ID=MMETSP0308-20130426/15598_1 /TAXON_ID=38269 /ORGANISM="Gloeochaete witrockiana, Strain SAG 46.84" /LENGTH=273 /DNA_ID=CAMNT_0027093041 /DNA_START=54 /DNA_END=875 /DNA_ORIENTATION=+
MAKPPSKADNEWYTGPPAGSGSARQTQNIDDIERPDTGASQANFKGMTSVMAATFMDSAFQSAKAQVGGWQSSFLNIQFLKPYFDIETREVLQRLMYSLLPKPALLSDTMVALPDLYGPLMLVFTWAALIQFGMRLGQTEVKEGTLVGSSLALAFTYWFGASGFFWTIAYIFESQLRLVQILCITGYALTGYCITQLIGSFIGNAMGVVCLIFFGGICSTVLGLVFYYNTPLVRKGVVAGCIVAAFHFLFLVYVKLFYVSFYKSIANEGVEDS